VIFELSSKLCDGNNKIHKTKKRNESLGRLGAWPSVVEYLPRKKTQGPEFKPQYSKTKAKINKSLGNYKG
jgi:hypothetical protein